MDYPDVMDNSPSSVPYNWNDDIKISTYVQKNGITAM